MTDTINVRAAVVRESGGPFQLEDLTLESPRRDEVLIRVVATGMCHTDMVVRDQFYPVPLPVILGHEGSGVVEQVGADVTRVKPGDHVVLSFASCGECDTCQRGHPNYCCSFFPLNFGGQRLDGSGAAHDHQHPVHDHFFGQSSFATYTIAHHRSVVKVRQDVPLELLGPLGCGIQTGAGAVMNALKVGPGQSFAAFGAGAVGLSAVMAARASGATTIVAVDPKENRLELAKELGATHTVNPTKADPVEAIREFTGGRGVDFTLESSGLPAVLRQAVDALDILGVAGVVGAPAMGVLAHFDWNDLMVPGESIRGIVAGDSIPEVFIPQLIDLYAQGRFPFDRLVKFYPPEQINEAAADSERGDTLKPIIRFG